MDTLPSCPRQDGADPLLVGDLSVSTWVSVEEYHKLFQEVLDALAELLREEPAAAETPRGRTFARVLH